MMFEMLRTAVLASGRPDATHQAQQPVVGPQQPARDKTITPAGKKIIRGRVTSADGRPLRRAQLRLTRDMLDGAKTATTNAQGRFEILDLPGGTHTLSATRAGYLPDRFTTVNGTLHDDRGNPAPRAAAIIFSEDAAQWDSALNTIRTARVNQFGVFSWRAMKPGTYLAIAIPPVNGNAWMDPDFLESLRARATRVLLKEGDTKQLDLVVVNLGSQ